MKIADFLLIAHFLVIPIFYYSYFKLETWRGHLPVTKELVWIAPDASLFEAIRTLILNEIHRLPIIDPELGNVLYILTHKRLLRFLFLYVSVYNAIAGASLG